MRVIKVIVDKKPEYCFNCILKDCTLGSYKTFKNKDGSYFSAHVPPEKCFIEESK